ncbi:MAG: hypothetical protein A2297_07005 [Elusimicrobia bacterium RIFOXYB2_FULL_48_7]|nr:MAG: hypothetical protein A2297_07005 [Elusimicrobia bacterium RIFOXYB2_FULL_48_7]
MSKQLRQMIKGVINCVITGTVPILLLASSLYADVHIATDCTRGAVMYQVSQAEDGDTVMIPAGTEVWRNSLSVTKGITIKGAGIDQTIIIDDTPVSGSVPFSITVADGKKFRLCHLTVRGWDGVNYPNGGISLAISITGRMWRVDHCKFLNLYKVFGLSGGENGLIDNCTWQCIIYPSNANVQQCSLSGGGNLVYTKPLVYGTSNATFFEDNYVYYDPAAPMNANRPWIDSHNGCQTVVRHNQICNTEIEVYSPGAAAGQRGSLSAEIYNNTWTGYLNSGQMMVPFSITGGNAIVSSNTVIGLYNSYNILLTVHRSCFSYGAYNRCDGMQAIDGNAPLDTGTHTGIDGQQALACAGKNWTINQWADYAVWNETDDSVGKITGNTSNTITVSSGFIEGFTIISSGTVATVNGQTITSTDRTPNVWYPRTLQNLFYVYNVTDNSYGMITANPNSSTLTAALTGGTRNSWLVGDAIQVTQGIPHSGLRKSWYNGDSFKITNGYPCMDNTGRGADPDGDRVQDPAPCYEWNNTINGTNLDFIVSYNGLGNEAGGYLIAGRDYYKDTVKPDWTPYTYPHPMQSPLFWGEVVDASSPTAPVVVRDGTNPSANWSFTYSTSGLSANWDACSDPETGISAYYIAIGTFPGGTAVSGGWQPVNLSTNVTRSNLSLTVGVTYYYSARSMNGINLLSDITTSDGQYVSQDNTPPSDIAAVRDGTGPSGDISFTYSTTTLSVNWNASSDPESGISKYWYSIGTTPGATDAASSSFVWASTSVTRTGLSLSFNATYYFNVYAQNSIGLFSSTTSSNGQYVAVDYTSPTAPSAVRDGTGSSDWSFAYSTRGLSSNWDFSTDAETGIYRYMYAISSTTVGGTNFIGWTDNGVSTYVTRQPLSLVGGVTYYFTVKAQNPFGLTSAVTNSNGQYIAVDTSPPTNIATVRDGTGTTDATFTFSTTTLSANWPASTDPESGISRYWYAIGTTLGGTNFAGWTSLWGSTYVNRGSLILAVGTTYYFAVKSENGVGAESAVTNSNGQYVAPDPTPPSAPVVVRDGTGAFDWTFTYSSVTLSANWDASADAESGITKYWYAVGTLAGSIDILSWAPTGNATDTSVTINNLTLDIGTTYYFSVKAENGVGAQSAVVSSNGQYIVENWSTPPYPVISNISVTNITQTEAVITWTTDRPATSQVNYGRTTSYGKYTMEDSALVTDHSVMLTGLTPAAGYHYRVITREGSGFQTISADAVFTTQSDVLPISENIHAYPNPAQPSVANPMKFRIAGATGLEVNIYTVSGRLIRKLSSAAGEILWDGKNSDGEKVGRGIYIYKITSNSGDTVTGKIALTK